MTREGQIYVPALDQWAGVTVLINPDGTKVGVDLNGVIASNAELNILHGATLSTAELNTLTGITATAAELNKAHLIAAAAGLVVMQSALFTQTAGDGTYTATLALPAGSRIIDIGVDGIAQWNAGTSASMVVGDGASANGFFLATNLNATDLLAGEINNIQHPGGLAGAYIAAEQRVLYSASARNVIGVVTQVGNGSNGRTRLYVVYSVAASTVNAVKV